MQQALTIFHSLSNFVPYEFSHQPQVGVDNDLTSNQVAQFIVQNPAKLAIELPHILKRVDAQSTVALILKELIENSDEESEGLVSQCLCKCMLSLPSELQEGLIDNHPLIVAQLMEYLNEEQRKVVLAKLAGELENWKDSLMNVFQSLEFDHKGKPPEDQPAGSFVTCLLEALPYRRKKQWIKYCCSELSFNNWAFFMTCLEGSDRALALRVSIRSFDYDLSEDGFLDCFEALALQMHHRAQVQEILNKILHKFYQAQKFSALVNQFSNLSLNVQICLLHAMPPSKQNLIFQKYHDNSLLMSAWLDELLLYQTDFSEKKGTLMRICNTLEEGTFSEILQMLNARNAKCGAYLLACLPDGLFQEFVFTIPFSLRSDLLSNGIADGTTLNLLRHLQEQKERKQIVYEVMGLDMENSTVPVEPNTAYTLKQCFHLLEELNSEMASDYSPFIMRIPPVLIGLLSTMHNEKAVLMELAPYMSEEQLKFLVSPMPTKQFCRFAEKNGTSLGGGRYVALLEGLYPHKLIYFAQFKTKKLEKIYTEFNEKYQELQLAFEEIEEGEMLTSLQIATLQKQVFDLHAWARIPNSADYRCLKRFLENPDNLRSFTEENLQKLRETMSKLEETMNNLNARRQLFEGPHAPITAKMAAISVSVIDQEEEVDLTMTLYPGFWLLVREGTLPYLGISPHSQLGITHAGELTCLGIQSNQDLEYLGISLSLQNKIAELVCDIEKLQPNHANQIVNSSSMAMESEASPTIKTLWQECMSIKLSDKEVRTLCEKAVLILDIPNINPNQFKEGCLKFCEKVLTFVHISEKNQLIIRGGGKALAESQTNENIVSVGSQLLVEALIILRGQHPLFCLQRYLLDNSHLKQAWEVFRVKGYHSIQALVENQIVKSPADFLRLDELAE